MKKILALVLTDMLTFSLAACGNSTNQTAGGETQTAFSEGKSHIHTGGQGGSMWSADQDSFLRAMAEAKDQMEYGFRN